MLLLHAVAATEPGSAPTEPGSAPAEPGSAPAEPGSGPPPSGLRGHPLCQVVAGALVGYATHFPATPHDLGRADLLAQHELVMRLGDCLPMRFPTWFDDQPPLRAYLHSHAEQLVNDLDRLRGLCELALTLVWTVGLVDTLAPTEPLRAGTPGARYLLEKRAQLAGSEQRRTRATELRDVLEQTAASAAAAQQHWTSPSDAVALSSALLIPRPRAAEVRARVLEVLGSEQDVRILVNGPWPPYSFVGR